MSLELETICFVEGSKITGMVYHGVLSKEIWVKSGSQEGKLKMYPSGLVAVGLPPNLVIVGSISWYWSQTVSKSSPLMFRAYLTFLLER